MTQHYDLEQQEQLATLKAFWEKWGNLITGVLVIVAFAMGAFNGWKYWQNKQATAAAVLLDQMNVGIEQKNRDAVLKNFSVLRADYAKTAQAGQGGLLAARFLVEQSDWAAAQETLDWVSQNASDIGYRALAVLHKSSVLMEQGKLDDALAAVQGYAFPFEYRALMEDRRGDILNLQNKKGEAIDAYNRAFENLDEFAPYRAVVQHKLGALGQAPRSLASAS